MSEKQPLFATKYSEKQTINPFADIGESSNFLDRLNLQPIVQQQEINEQLSIGEADNLPKKTLGQEHSNSNTWGTFGNKDAPVWNYYPPRKGPLLWWQKDKQALTPVEQWHREHPMSPAFKAPDIDNRRHKEEPRKPSHGRSEPWYVEED